jgi:hypothetical protein
LSKVGDIKIRMNQYMEQEIVKTEAIKKLKFEFKESAKNLDDLWLLVKEEKEKKSNKKSKVNNEPGIKKSNLEITTMVVKGKYASYIKQGDTVKSGDLMFYTIADIEEYKKREIEEFNAKIDELIQVFGLEVR